MLHQPERHEALRAEPWNEAIARDAIDTIVRDTRDRFTSDAYWPWHPKDVEPADDLAQPALPLYFGAAGVIWALRYLQDVGATDRGDRYDEHFADLTQRSRTWMSTLPPGASASFLFGEIPLLLMQADRANDANADRLALLIESNKAHPARELMWGSPGTMLAALFLHERFGGARWAALFRQTARQLRSELVWSDALRCRYWTQQLYGRESSYLDAVHGFVATASVLIRGRGLLEATEWAQWESTIAATIARTATCEDGLANWPTQMSEVRSKHPYLMQFCHGSPGFVICLADFPDPALDELLLAAGEATWQAGPLTKGSNLCHGTGGNGYAFLKLFARTGDARWLERARAFAMHGIRQTWDERRRYGHLRYSLWTGDPGFAIYLWDCIRAQPAFPTLDVFYG